MKKGHFIILVLSPFIMVCHSYAQEVISGRSEVEKFKLEPHYDRGLPPNLFAELRFADANNNGILEAEESAALQLIITNKGKGVAQGLKIELSDQKEKDTALQIDASNQTIPYLFPDEKTEVNFSFKAGPKIKTADHKFTIKVFEHFGYDMDPAHLLLHTLEYQEPQLTFAGYEVIDYGEGTSHIVQDGQIQPGEYVKLKMMIQNVGDNVARNVTYNVKCDDDNVFLPGKTEGSLKDIAVGEVKHFWLTVSPNKRIDPNRSLPLTVSLNVERQIGGLEDYKVPIAMNNPPPAAKILEVKSDWDKLKKQSARFEYTSNKFVAKIDSIINIREVPPSQTKRNHAVAVVFGIEEYDELPPAPYAENDAQLIKEYFRNVLGINEVVVYNSDEARGLIFDDVFNPDYGDLQKAIIKGKTDIFVYYSGHGIPSKEGEQLFFFPSDGKKERLELQGYNLNRFYQNLEKLGARSVTVFIDACFSGASRKSERFEQENLVAFKGIRIKPKLYQPWENNPNFSVFTSSGPAETSLAFDLSRTGLFTYYLCAGLQGNADKNQDKKITSGELHDYIKKEVTDVSKKISGLQIPEFHGNEDVILVEY